MDTIKFVNVTVEGELVKLTSAYHVRRTINSINKREILTSSFYYDIQANAPYISGSKYSYPRFTETHPRACAIATKKLRKLGAVRSQTSVFLTEAGVYNLLHVFNIDLETLLQGGPRIPTKQNTLFGGATPDKEIVSNSVLTARKLFPPSEKKKARTLQGSRVRLTKPGISIHTANDKRLLNMSKSLMPIVEEIEYVADSAQKGILLRADVKVAEVDNQKLLGINFNADGEFIFKMHRRMVNGVYHLQNIGYLIDTNKPLRNNRLWTVMRDHDLFQRSFINPEIGGNVLMFDITEEG